MSHLVNGLAINDVKEELKDLTVSMKKLKNRIEVLKTISTQHELQNLFTTYEEMESNGK